ncbi:MAG: glycosyltransferase family 9 protein [Sedimentisphaerales bacterium]
MGKKNRDILNILNDAENQASRLSAKAIIIQPGAIGDCILTLPLADSLKTHFGIGTILMLGRSNYIDYFPGRTCIDGIKDIDSVDLHKLFVEHKTFELEDGDPLISEFAGFREIITFLGEPGGNFEANLTFTVYCSNAADITTLCLKPPANFTGHISQYYLNLFISAQHPDMPPADKNISCNLKKTYITPGKSDLTFGRKILESAGIKSGKNIVIIHPGSGGVSKCWHIDNFYMLAEQLCDKDIKVVFLLGPAEMERFGKKNIDALGVVAPVLCELSLTETFQTISCANCFIGNDSGITHLAATAGIPTIACFGPTDPAKYGPVGPQITAFKFEASDFNAPSPDKTEEIAKQALKYLNS